MNAPSGLAPLECHSQSWSLAAVVVSQRTSLWMKSGTPSMTMTVAKLSFVTSPAAPHSAMTPPTTQAATTDNSISDSGNTTVDYSDNSVDYSDNSSSSTYTDQSDDDGLDVDLSLEAPVDEAPLEAI